MLKKLLFIIKISLLSYYYNIMFFIANYFITFAIFRAKFISLFYKNACILKKVSIRKNVTFYGGEKHSGYIKIHNNVFINEECFLDHTSFIEIFENVSIGMRTTIISSSHVIDTPIRCGKAKRMKTIIEKNVWIGANVLIYPGVTIGEGSVVGAGCIVKKDIPKNHIYTPNKLYKIQEERYEKV